MKSGGSVSPKIHLRYGGGNIWLTEYSDVKVSDAFLKWVISEVLSQRIEPMAGDRVTVSVCPDALIAAHKAYIELFWGNQEVDIVSGKPIDTLQEVKS